jgi:hypothetical protein
MGDTLLFTPGPVTGLVAPPPRLGRGGSAPSPPPPPLIRPPSALCTLGVAGSRLGTELAGAGPGFSDTGPFRSRPFFFSNVVEWARGFSGPKDLATLPRAPRRTICGGFVTICCQSGARELVSIPRSKTCVFSAPQPPAEGWGSGTGGGVDTPLRLFGLLMGGGNSRPCFLFNFGCLGALSAYFAGGDRTARVVPAQQQIHPPHPPLTPPDNPLPIGRLLSVSGHVYSGPMRTLRARPRFRHPFRGSCSYFFPGLRVGGTRATRVVRGGGRNIWGRMIKFSSSRLWGGLFSIRVGGGFQWGGVEPRKALWA